MKQAHTRISCLLTLFVVIGCKDMDRFDTRHGERYCGSLVGQGVISTGFEEFGWVGSGTKHALKLTLNTSELLSKDGVPARVTSNDASFGPCSPRPLFDGARVRTVGAVLGDRLSSMQLNEDHEEDVVTFVDSTCAGSMIGVLSLVKNGEVELRVLRPAPETVPADGATPESVPRFGLFVLRKTKDDCGF